MRKGRFPSQPLSNPQSRTSSNINPTNHPQNYHEQAKSITTLRSGKTFENPNVPSPVPSPTPSSIVTPIVEESSPLEPKKEVKMIKNGKTRRMCLEETSSHGSLPS